MDFQPLEYVCSKHKESPGDDPEIERKVKALPEPDLVDHGITVTVDNIEHRVELEDRNEPGRHPGAQRIDIPHDRCHPDLDLNNDRYDLRQIPEKDDDRAGRIADAQAVHKKAEGIIEDLYHLDIRKEPAERVEYQHERNEEKMHKECRDLLDDRKDRDLKDDLLDQIGVLHERVRPADQDILEKEPGNET